MMKRLIRTFLVVSVSLTPLILPIIVQPSWAQGQDLRVEKLGLLIQKARQQTQQGQPEQALKTWQEVRDIARQLQDIENEVVALNGIGEVYNRLSKMEKALESFKEALSMLPKVGDSKAKAGTLTNIGVIYNSTSQQEEALKYLKIALPMTERVGDRAQQATTLIIMGQVYNSISRQDEALKYFKQALLMMRETSDRAGEATTLDNMGVAYKIMSKQEEALEYLEQAWKIRQEGSNSAEKATTLSNIGEVYNSINQPEKALKYLNQALAITREVGYRAGEAVTLNQMGIAYSINSQTEESLKYLNQALLIRQEVGYRAGEADTLSNIARVYRDMKQPTQAIDNWEKSVEITLKMRRDLQRENRKKFLEGERERAVALVDILIDQNQADRAFQWVNIATTADLADYTRLINAQVANPQAQKAIDEWNQKNQQLQSRRRQLQDKFSENLSRQMRELETEVNRKAEEISRQFPEVAELFETTPKDIAQLKASIPPDTVVIQPVLLTNVKNVPNTVALFVLTKDSLSVKKITIYPAEFDKLLTEHREQISSELTSDYRETGGKLYDILIRPVEDQIQALSPKQLSIIATGKLRYIPFETLYDRQNSKFLIQKYPVNYLTRISTRSIPNSTLQGGILALGNPVTRDPYNLPDSPQEVQSLTQIFPGSLSYIGNAATLDQFKTQAPRFPFLHLATHGCFQPEGCCLPNSPNCKKPDRVDLKPNTILFADRELDIADAALLGLQNTRLLTLSACQTAMQANSNGEEISGVAYLFERAGAQAVMASLWSVSDSATKDLMVQFYQDINKGMSINEALWKAKLSQIQRTPHPFYWSPFILIGDGR
ncbi:MULTISPECIES: CHAT domain-containing protein [unclassified Microcoleus]|nr:MULTISPECIES: CHAT domain-containing protein [unclassified Microcoleus]